MRKLNNGIYNWVTYVFQAFVCLLFSFILSYPDIPIEVEYSFYSLMVILIAGISYTIAKDRLYKYMNFRKVARINTTDYHSLAIIITGFILIVSLNGDTAKHYISILFFIWVAVIIVVGATRSIIKCGNRT